MLLSGCCSVIRGLWGCFYRWLNQTTRHRLSEMTVNVNLLLESQSKDQKTQNKHKETQHYLKETQRDHKETQNNHKMWNRHKEKQSDHHESAVCGVVAYGVFSNVFLLVYRVFFSGCLDVVDVLDVVFAAENHIHWHCWLSSEILHRRKKCSRKSRKVKVWGTWAPPHRWPRPVVSMTPNPDLTLQ